MQKNTLKSYVQQTWQQKERTSSFNSIKSQKALKILTTDAQNSRPFRRKQDPTINIRKSQYSDIGKLISNTSFGSNPDIRKIISTSPQHYFDARLENQDKPADKKPRPTLRETKSFSDLEKVTQIFKGPSSMGLIGSMENIQPKKCEEKPGLTNAQAKQKKNETKYWKAKIQQLMNEKKQLSDKCKNLSKKLEQLQDLLAQKETTISQYSLELMKKIEEHEQQRQINKCLEDIVTQLNAKIAQMLAKSEEEQRLAKNNPEVGKQELEREVHELREKVYTLNRVVHGLQVQTIIMKKIKHELQKQKSVSKCLEKENKNLKERILTMMKITRVKPTKLSLKQQLDYSVSFEFQH